MNSKTLLPSRRIVFVEDATVRLISSNQKSLEVWTNYYDSLSFHPLNYIESILNGHTSPLSCASKF